MRRTLPLRSKPTRYAVTPLAFKKMEMEVFQAGRLSAQRSASADRPLRGQEQWARLEGRAPALVPAQQREPIREGKEREVTQKPKERDLER